MINLFKYCADMENCESFKNFGYIYIQMIFIKNGGEKIEVTHYCRMKVERKMLKTQVKVTLIAEIFFFKFYFKR